MIFAVDVYYRDNKAIVAGVLFNDWEDSRPSQELTIEVAEVAEYEPGQFYKRELPCILEILDRLDRLPEYIVVDGYVYLDRDRKPGLGKYLYDAIDGKSIVIGVAKNRFQDIPTHTEVFRGDSQRPLYITAVGMEDAIARDAIARMSGKYRIPVILKMVDRLSKTRDT